MNIVPTNPSACNAGRKEGQFRKEIGMKLAADNRRKLVLHAQIRLLKAILAAPDCIATTDDIVDDLSAEYADSGKWVGVVPKSLVAKKLIRRVGYRPSCRPPRHAAPVSVWAAAVGDAALLAHIANLRAELARMPDASPSDPRQSSLFPEA